MSFKDTLKKFVSPIVYWNLIALVLATLMVMAGLWFWMNDFTHHGVEVEVPDVTGKLPTTVTSLPAACWSRRLSKEAT